VDEGFHDGSKVCDGDGGGPELKVTLLSLSTRHKTGVFGDQAGLADFAGAAESLLA
jgi:hypothetical protein